MFCWNFSAFLTVDGKKITVFDGWRLNFRPFDSCWVNPIETFILTYIQPMRIFLNRINRGIDYMQYSQ